jgi:hypothetical protein
MINFYKDTSIGCFVSAVISRLEDTTGNCTLSTWLASIIPARSQKLSEAENTAQMIK